MTTPRVLSTLQFMYDALYVGETEKQWKISPSMEKKLREGLAFLRKQDVKWYAIKMRSEVLPPEEWEDEYGPGGKSCLKILAWMEWTQGKSTGARAAEFRRAGAIQAVEAKRELFIPEMSPEQQKEHDEKAAQVQAEKEEKLERILTKLRAEGYEGELLEVLADEEKYAQKIWWDFRSGSEITDMRLKRERLMREHLARKGETHEPQQASPAEPLSPAQGMAEPSAPEFDPEREFMRRVAAGEDREEARKAVARMMEEGGAEG